MRKLLFLILPATLLVGCQNNPKTEEKKISDNAFFETEFSDYKELDALTGYEKEIDTSVHMGGGQDTYRLMNLRKNNDYLVLFYKVTKMDNEEIHHVAYRAIDTIQVRNLKEDEWVTVGYCYHEDYYEGEIIAVVKNTDGSELAEIIKAWRANPESEKVEELKDLEGLKCLNEFFESENSTIPIEELS